MKQYLDLMRYIRDHGRVKTDRTGTGTTSIFGYQMRFNLAEGLPVVTTKKVHLPAVIHELIWFLNGSTNIKYLVDNNVHIWDDWADANGDLGPVYGAQWRKWPGDITLHHADMISPLDSGIVASHFDNDNKGVIAVQKKIDQIADVMHLLKTNPDSRRMIVSAWNVAEVPNMKLPPCHALFQFYTDLLTLDERLVEVNKLPTSEIKTIIESYPGPKDVPIDDDILRGHLDTFNIPTRKLSCQLYQRSCDTFLGVPFNIASYAILTHMFAQQLNMTVGDFVWTGGDVHLYSNHGEQVETQLARKPLALPQLRFKRKPDSISDYKYEDFEIVGYEHHPAIKAKVAV